MEQNIKDTIINIYGKNNIKTTFITGSYAAGKARPDSDIDIFFCYSDSTEAAESKKQEFIKFYFELHKELKRTPDDISPGEPLLFSDLKKALEKI